METDYCFGISPIVNETINSCEKPGPLISNAYQ